MLFHCLLCVVSLVLDVLSTAGLATQQKDLEIALLRQQLRVLERRVQAQVRCTRPEKVMLVALVNRFNQKHKAIQDYLRSCVLLIKPETVLKWHRELVRRKWTFQRVATGGRPRIDGELETLIVRLASENGRMGYGKIQGELLKLGYQVDETTIRNVLRRHRIPPAPQRGKSSWRTFLKHYQQQILACDFFTVETATLQTVYVLFFIELGSRRVHLAGCTPTPNSAWVTQQARQFTWTLAERTPPMRFLIHDRDTKFSRTFDTVFQGQGIEIIRTPFRSPKANAFAERWVRSVRAECLDHLLILNQRHLRRVLTEYIDYYNASRPHQGIAQHTPIPSLQVREGPLQRRDVLGGILHDYYRKVA